MNESAIVNFVEACIVDLLLEAAHNPLCYFSEKSLQSRLVWRLLNNPELSRPFSTGIHSHKAEKLNWLISHENGRAFGSYHENAYSTTPVQIDYGNNLPGAYKIDVVVLDPTEIASIHNVQLQRAIPGKKPTRYQYLVPLAGIELGTEKSSWQRMSTDHLDNDYLKVKECRHGYILNIMRNSNYSSRQTTDYAEKKAQETAFKEAVQTRFNHNERVKWIAMISNLALAEVDFLAKENEWRTFDRLTQIDEFENAVKCRFEQPDLNPAL